MLSPYNLKAWVEENRHLLKPPVGIEEFYADESVRTCESCHAVMQPPPANA